MSWNDIAKDYDQHVYSITRWSTKRERILSQMRDGLKILILGCGSEVYLQKDILEKYPNSKITLSDYYDKMLRVSKERFNHENLTFKQEDMKELSYEQEFDVVISTNSILMSTLDENRLVFENIKESLKPEGVLMAYLPSYDSVMNSLSKEPNLNNVFIVDNKEQSLEDPIDHTKQSFHSLGSLKGHLLGLFSYNLEKVSCSETIEEFNHFKELYGSVLSDDLIKEVFEYFIIAKVV